MKESLSPFIFGTTVSGAGFTDREEVGARLSNNLLRGINTMILSPRRWGKTSLVEKVIKDIRRRERQVKTVSLDLFSAGNKEEFLEIFAREVIKASATRWQEWMNSGRLFFKSLTPRFSVGIDPNEDFNLSFDWKELKKYPDEVLNLPEIIAKKRKIRMVICIDEFQNLAQFPGYSEFEKKLRSIWQKQKHVTYCLYGSRRHMMADIFNNPAKPFYRFGDIIHLGKIETKKWIPYLVKGFKKTGKAISPDHARIIAETMKNQSWYVQQLAHYTWNHTKKTAGPAEIELALKELLNANQPLYQKETENLSITQINLLKAVVCREKRFTSTAVMDQYHLGTPRNASKNKDILIKADIIQEANGTYEFVDPAFELWFTKQFRIGKSNP